MCFRGGALLRLPGVPFVQVLYGFRLQWSVRRGRVLDVLRWKDLTHMAQPTGQDIARILWDRMRRRDGMEPFRSGRGNIGYGAASRLDRAIRGVTSPLSLSHVTRRHETAGGSDPRPSLPVFSIRGQGASAMTFDVARAFALLELQLKLECTRVVHGTRLVPFPCPNPDPPSRVLIVRFHDQVKVFLREDVGDAVADRILASPPGDMEGAVARVRALMDTNVDWTGSTYVATTPLDGALTSGVVQRPLEQGASDQSFAILDGDRVLSGCSSSRENDSAAEAWVWTDSAARRRGYGRRCVAAWANDALRRGKVPFYSHARDNHASRQLARSLDLTWVFDACGLT